MDIPVYFHECVSSPTHTLSSFKNSLLVRNEIKLFYSFTKSNHFYFCLDYWVIEISSDIKRCLIS